MKKMQGISKKALLFGSFILLINSSGALSAISVAERGRQIVKTKLAQTRAKIRALSKALDGYQECVLQGTCTKEQKSNLKKLAVATAALVTLLATMTIVGLGTAYQEKQPRLQDTAQKVQVKLDVMPEKEKAGQEDLNFKFLMAVLNNNIDLARNLLVEGANIEAKDIGGRTALRIAEANKDMDMINMLLDLGATWPK